MDLSVAEIAQIVGGTVAGDGAVRLTGVNGLHEAGPGDLCFVRSPRYYPLLDTTRASAVLIAEAPAGLRMPAIVVGSPDLAFAMVLKHCESQQRVHPKGVHPAAVVAPSAVLGADAALDAHAVVAEGAVLGDRVVVYAGAYVGRNCRVGDDTVIYPNAVLREDTELGARCIVHAGAVIGSDGFGFAPLGGAWLKIPQVGRVAIGDDVEIGANTAIDRATFGETRIGSGVKIDNLVQVGHNVRIGAHSAIAALAGIAGSAVVGEQVRIGAQSGIAGHLTVHDGVSIGGKSGVSGDIEAGETVLGLPAVPIDECRRVWIATRKTPDMLKRLRQLERQVEALEKKLHER